MEEESHSDDEMNSGRSRSSSKRSGDLREVNMAIDGDRSVASYDEAFNKAGCGLWQYFLLIQCGLANASDAMEIMCISYILAPIRDSMKVSHRDLSALTFVLFFGMFFGGYIWGSLADTYGRRQIVYISLAVNAIFGALSSVCTSFSLILFFRFVSGFGAGGSLPAVFTYFSEFQPTKYRGAMISALATFWMAGNILIGLLAWAVLPSSPALAAVSPYGQQWRLFAILCSIPSALSAFFFFFMPESPKYLHVNNRLTESLAVLKTMYKWNHLKKDPCTFQISRLLSQVKNDVENEKFDPDDTETDNLLGTTNSHNSKYEPEFSGRVDRVQNRNVISQFCHSLVYNFKMFKTQFVAIYAQCRRSSSVTLTVAYVLIAFGGYGMAMWMPVLMEKTEKYNGSPCRGHTGNMSVINNTTHDPAEMYIDVLIGSCAQLPGNIITALLMDRLGAKCILITVLFFSAISVLFFWLVNAKVEVIVMNAVYSGIQVGVWNALDVITVEMYPTSIRSAATGNMTGISRLGAILGTSIFGLFMDVDCSVPIMTVFSVYVICGLISFKLPNTRMIVLD